MKKLLFIMIVSLMMFSCISNEKKPEAATTSTNSDMQAVYEQNLASMKSWVTAFENKNLTDYANNVADSVSWHSPVYGDTVTTKTHYMESLKYWTDNWDSLHLSDGIFLPGIDTINHQMDGSVRYYGRWDGVHKATGKATHVNFYGVYRFNSDHKMVWGSDYFDVGGLINAVLSKKK